MKKKHIITGGIILLVSAGIFIVVKAGKQGSDKTKKELADLLTRIDEAA